MENKELYYRQQTPPDWAKKTINAGRLKGKTDISPQWRIEAMTETYGLYGFGWYFKVTSKSLEQGAGGEVFVSVGLDLFVRVGEEWSMPAHGEGGDKLVTKELKGMYNDDDAFKKAVTDALGNAMKYFGIGAEVYRNGHKESKYVDKPASPKTEKDVRCLLTGGEVKKWDGVISFDQTTGFYYVTIDGKKLYPVEEQLEKLKKLEKYKK